MKIRKRNGRRLTFAEILKLVEIKEVLKMKPIRKSVIERVEKINQQRLEKAEKNAEKLIALCGALDFNINIFKCDENEIAARKKEIAVFLNEMSSLEYQDMRDFMISWYDINKVLSVLP